jgi:mono/diheme cytochrome c family protein
VANYTTRLVVERDGKRYLVDLASHTISEAGDPIETGAALLNAQTPGSAQTPAQPGGSAVFKEHCVSCHGPDGKGVKDIHTPDFTNPQMQATITDQQMTDIITHGKAGTMMPAWGGKLTDEEISAVRGFLRSLAAENQSASAAQSKPKVYTPGDDLLFSLPTGRRIAKHAMIINFTHRFPYTPAFTGPAEGGSLLGLDDFALPSFGFRYGVTDRLSVSIFRSPTFISRPIQLMAAYNFLDERDGQPLNAAVRVSIEGLNNFSRDYTENLEGVFSRSLQGRAQLYFLPTLSLHDNRLFSPNPF